MNSDTRNLRSAYSALASAVSLATGDDGPGPDPCVVVTVADPDGADYPTDAQSAYPCKLQRVAGTEATGSPVVLSTVAGVFWVLNLGNAVPGLGTAGIVSEVIDGVRVMHFDG